MGVIEDITTILKKIDAQTSPTGGAPALAGFNIGNDQNATPPGTPYKALQNAEDLLYLKGRVSRLRVALTYGKDQNDLANLKQLALDAKKQGFFVQFGITCGVDDAYWPTFLSTDMLAVAAWCETNRIDEFSIGNEESWRSHIGQSQIPEKQIRDDIRNAVAKVKGVYHGSVVYCDAEGVLDAWIAEGRGNIDRLYFNVYDNLTNFQNIINKIITAFGTNHGGLSEWAAQHPFSQMNMTPVQYAAEITNRQAIVKKSGLPAYAFTWRMGPGSDWEFVSTDNSSKPGLSAIIGS